jgi:putative glycosyltransferase (TIGR04372 family)
VLLALPLAAVVFVVFAVRTALRAKPRVLVLAIDGEFAPFVNFMEVLRLEYSVDRKHDFVLLLSRHRHDTLSDMYEDILRIRLMWSTGLAVVLQQALLLQPTVVLALDFRTIPTLARLRTADWNVIVPRGLESLRDSLLESLGLRPDRFVAMAVYAAAYERQRNPRFVQATHNLISIGAELVEGIDHLKRNNMEVVLLGSSDTERSHIPRQFLRLSDFGRLGGPEEVALASCCKYFWTDNVGAWCLTLPFGRPVLHTNYHHKTISLPTLGRDMYVPRRYETLDGRGLSLREMIYREGSPHQAAKRGELRMFRNSPVEIVEAHTEMLERVNGTWTGTAVGRQRQERVMQLYLDHPGQYHPLLIPEAFLVRHEYLLD